MLLLPVVSALEASGVMAVVGRGVAVVRVVTPVLVVTPKRPGGTTEARVRVVEAVVGRLIQMVMGQGEVVESVYTVKALMATVRSTGVGRIQMGAVEVAVTEGGYLKFTTPVPKQGVTTEVVVVPLRTKNVGVVAEHCNT